MKYRQKIVLSVIGIIVCVSLIPAGILFGGIDGEYVPVKVDSDHVTTHVESTVVSSSKGTESTRKEATEVSKGTERHVIGSHQGTVTNITGPWTIWKSWVQPDSLYTSENVFYSVEMGVILNALATYPVTSFDTGYRGTQLKASMHLAGNQQTVFKPKRYSRDVIIDGPDDPCKGFDRHNGEIASFHLDGILGYRLAPPVVGRKINLTELLPVTSEKLYKTYFQEGGNTCFYGVCLYCKPVERACADGVIMEGSVTLWLPNWYQLRTWRHPYQRTYIPNRKARWEVDDNYCAYLLQPTSDYYNLLPDVWDTSVLDFLIGNADRHHFETYAPNGNSGRLMHIDNGKSFGNPHHDELSILTPLKQCCKLRNSTFQRLKTLQSLGLSTLLDESLKRDPLYPVLTQEHMVAIDRRLDKIIQLINECALKQHGINNVLFNTWSNNN